MVAELLLDLVAWVSVIPNSLVVAVSLVVVTSAVSVGITRVDREGERRRRIENRWERLITRALRVRRLERYFAYLGHHLNHHLNRNLLNRIRLVWRNQMD